MYIAFHTGPIKLIAPILKKKLKACYHAYDYSMYIAFHTGPIKLLVVVAHQKPPSMQ
jgi:hypothetical protein